MQKMGLVLARGVKGNLNIGFSLWKIPTQITFVLLLKEILRNSSLQTIYILI